MISLNGRRILIFGLAASGLAAAGFASDRGAKVFAWDDCFTESGPDEALLQKLQGCNARPVSPASLREDSYDLAVVSPGIPLDNPNLCQLRSRGLPCISEIEFAWMNTGAPIAAITGTNGKSTTTVLAGRMLQASVATPEKVKIGGNLSAEGYDLPLISAVDQTTDDGWLVAEVSSFQLELCFDFKPRAAALLNVTEDHLDRHSTFQHYLDAKMRIFQAQNSDDFAILGLDCPAVRQAASRVAARKLWFSVNQQVDEGAYLKSGEYLLRVDGIETPFARVGQTALWTSFDRLNILAAACIAWSMGATIQGISRACREFGGLPHRMEDCGEVNGVRWINNSMCTNPAAGIAAVEAVAEFWPVTVIAGGKQKDCDFSQWGRRVAEKARRLIVIGEDAPLLAEAAKAGGLQEITHAPGLPEAMKLARSVASHGEAVALIPAMASFGEFTNFKDRGQRFRQIVESFRKQEGGAEP